MKLSIKDILKGPRAKPPTASEMRKMHVEDIANALDITPAKASRIAAAIEGLMKCDDDDNDDEGASSKSKPMSVMAVLKGK